MASARARPASWSVTPILPNRAAHSVSCGSALHPRAPLPSSETVSEHQFLNQENDDSGDYGFVE